MENKALLNKYIQLAKKENKKLFIYDAVGKVSGTVTTSAGADRAEFGDELRNGAYIVQIRHGVTRKVVKVIKH